MTWLLASLDDHVVAHRLDRSDWPSVGPLLAGRTRRIRGTGAPAKKVGEHGGQDCGDVVHGNAHETRRTR